VITRATPATAYRRGESNLLAGVFSLALGGFAACFPEESERDLHAPPPEQHGAAAWIQTGGRGRRSRDAGGCEAPEDWLIKLFISGLSELFLC